ncbi:helix-turn-helix domain-containing protein [Pseudoduganella eburnea]|uniref:Helix-turn-helix domain-containing protein n=1 Tax=Massilia eburnea TaxID=1776165 RepID=A0A6L6QNQ5_9BURK|nr:helix-turn-helix domain-containing protein [Massilia eburnea]MTW13296.1 helix-turn-helix domain-containing protein [Massilia eburnea]
MRDADLTLAPMRLAIAPPPKLAGVVRYFHIECHSPGAVLVPATPCPMVTFFIRGGSRFAGADGRERIHSAPFVTGPLTSHFPAVWEAGTTFASAVIDAGAFGRLFDVAPGELRDAVVPLADAAPDWPGIPALEEQLRGGKDSGTWVAHLSDWLLRRLDQREAGLRRGVQPFSLPPLMLALPTEEIAARFGISVRQLERRVMASYGQSMRDSRRMMRYIRALSRMIATPLRHGGLTRLAVDCGYHDQAHMVRDFVQYTGLAPKALMDSAADPAGALRLLRYDDASRPIVTREDY